MINQPVSMPTQEQEELMEAYMAAQKARGVTEANMEKVVLLVGLFS